MFATAKLRDAYKISYLPTIFAFAAEKTGNGGSPAVGAVENDTVVEERRANGRRTGSPPASLDSSVFFGGTA
jgi:hypothetical protein